MLDLFELQLNCLSPLSLSEWIISTSPCTGRNVKLTPKFTDDEDDDAGVTKACDKAGIFEHQFEIRASAADQWVAGQGPWGICSSAKRLRPSWGQIVKSSAAVNGVPVGP